MLVLGFMDISFQGETTMSDLVKRLRDVTQTYEPCSIMLAEIGREAADRIKQLERENAELRELLEYKKYGIWGKRI